MNHTEDLGHKTVAQTNAVYGPNRMAHRYLDILRTLNPSPRVLEAIEKVEAEMAIEEARDDLVVAATRMHEVLYQRGEELNAMDAEVVNAFGQLQDALKKRGWRP